MVRLKDPKPPPYVPRVDEDGNEETVVSLLGKTVKFEQQTGDDEGLVREFNAQSGMCKVQLFSGKVVRIMRTEFETVENLIKKRQKRARDAITEKYAQAELDAKMMEDGSMGDDFDETTMTSAMTGSVAKRNMEALDESQIDDELIHDDESQNEEEGAGSETGDFLGGDARYSSVARKYEQFRALLAGAKADRAVRRPGKSVLDDLETIASDDKTVVTAKSKESLTPQVVGRYGRGNNDDSSMSTGTNTTSKTLWTFGSVQHHLLSESTDLLIISKFKKKRNAEKDRKSLGQQGLLSKFKGFGVVEESQVEHPSKINSSISTPNSRGSRVSISSPFSSAVVANRTKCIFPGEDEEAAGIVPCSPYASPTAPLARGIIRTPDSRAGGMTGKQGMRGLSSSDQTPLRSRERVAFSPHASEGGRNRAEEPYSATSSMGGSGGGFGDGYPIGDTHYESNVPISEWGNTKTTGEVVDVDFENNDGIDRQYEDDHSEGDFEADEGYDYVFPIIIERRRDGNVVTRWAPGSNVEIAMNKGDTLQTVAIEFAIKYELPSGVADSIEQFLEKTVKKDPSSSFSREIVYHDTCEDEDELEEKQSEEEDRGEDEIPGTAAKTIKMTGAELDRIEAEAAFIVEMEARRPLPEGGTPLRHPKRHDVYGANVPAHALKALEAEHQDLDNVDDDAKRGDSRMNRGNSRGNTGGGGNTGSGNTGTPKSGRRSTNDTKKGASSGDKSKESEGVASQNNKKLLFTPDTAFMVMAVLRKGRKDADRVALALKTVLTDISPTKEGCGLLVKHKVLELICDVSELHWMDVKIQVLACLVLRNLLVGHAPMRRKERLLLELRNHLKRLMNIEQVVESCLDSFRIMATESCKLASFGDVVVKDLSIFDFVLALASSSERVTHADIVHPALRYLSLVVGLRQRPACKQLVLGDGINFALSCLQIHSGNPSLMSAALRLLVLAAKIDGDVTTGGPSPNHGVAVAVSKVRLPPQHKSNKAALINMKQQYTANELKKKKKEGLKRFKEDVESQGASIGGASKKDGEESASSEEDDGSVFSVLSRKPEPVVSDVDDEMIDGEHDVGSVHPVEVILHTMMRLHSDSKLQLGGTELIQTLIENQDARRVLDRIPGGLDWLCQGPDEGNVLIHWRDGHLKNKGWAYGEQKYHTGTAGEYLWDGTQAMASLDRSLAHVKFGDSIEADDFGIPTKHSVHAHQELASMHHVVREYDQSEYHYQQALQKTHEFILKAKDEVFCQQSTVKAAQALGTDILPPIHIKNTRGSNNNTSTNVGVRGGGDGISSSLIKQNHEQNESSGKRVLDDDRTVAGTLERGVFHFSAGEGGVMGERLYKAEKELQAALVRQQIILSNRNMMRRDRENGAEHSLRLELWTPASLQTYLPASQQPINHVEHSHASDYTLHPPPSSLWSSYAATPFNPPGKIVDENTSMSDTHTESGLMKEMVPLKLPSIAGTSQPPRWETFTDDSLRAHFAVYKRLALLPLYGESKEDWRERIVFWERESGQTVAQLAMVERDKEFPGLFPM